VVWRTTHYPSEPGLSVIRFYYGYRGGIFWTSCKGDAKVFPSKAAAERTARSAARPASQTGTEPAGPS
jgi:hypothetical protein